MAEEMEEVAMNPSKRIRLSSRLNSDTDDYDGELSSFSSNNEYNSGTPVSSEGTLTSDSGFNEFTPPHCVDEELLHNQLPSCSSATQLSTESNISSKLVSSDDDSMDSTVSDCSGLSSISNFSGQDWKPTAGPISWVERQMLRGKNPRTILAQILGDTYHVPDDLSNTMLWHAIVSMLSSEVPRREKLLYVNLLDDVVQLIRVCRKIIILTGAGVSVSCGIPDFRSKDGIYARLAVDFPSLPDPQAMFDIGYFRKDPRPFFKFAREIYPGQFKPSLCHKFIQFVEDHNRLLRNYTQNIDTLEQVAGINKVIQCHGSFATATCQTCKFKVSSSVIKDDIFKQVIPKCSKCTAKKSNISPSFNNQLIESAASSSNCIPFSEEGSSAVDASESVMKPDIVFFGEGLSEEFHEKMATDKDECDLLIVIGSSLKVRPVALIPSSLPANVPQILINREPLPHMTFDVELLGNCDVIVSELCRRLGWEELNRYRPLKQIFELPPKSDYPYNLTSSRANNIDNDPHPKDESDIEALRACWKPKIKENLASRLPGGKYFYNGQHRYIFPGAEVFYDPDEEEDYACDSSFDEYEDTTKADAAPESSISGEMNATTSAEDKQPVDKCETTNSANCETI